jgi:predicted amidophosphoribosyltransferase
MNECPYCFARVGPTDIQCPNCGRKIEHWQTGFYSREPLPKKTRNVVWFVAVLLFLLIVGGFAKSCHWI